MTDPAYFLERNAYFKDDEHIYIQKSDNFDFNGVTHSHHFIELVYIISGSALHKVGNISYPVRKGDIVMIDYNIPHSFSFDALSEEGLVTYDLLFTPEFFNISGIEQNEFYYLTSSYLFSSVFEEFEIRELPRNLIHSNSRDFLALFMKIYKEFNAQEKGHKSLIRAYVLELIVKIFRELDKQRPNFTDSHKELVLKAIQYMQQNFKEPITLNNLLPDVFLSNNYFRQLFKKVTGTSITSYIQELRISEACRLLETTEVSSAEIAYQCGFNDTKFFYMTFKKEKGMTPAEYRRSLRADERRTDEGNYDIPGAETSGRVQQDSGA